MAPCTMYCVQSIVDRKTLQLGQGLASVQLVRQLPKPLRLTGPQRPQLMGTGTIPCTCYVELQLAKSSSRKLDVDCKQVGGYLHPHVGLRTHRRADHPKT